MFDFTKKISKKYLLIGMSILNILMVISLIFFLLLSSGYLENIYYLIAFPIDYLSNNYLVLTFFLLIEILIVFYSWYFYKDKGNLKDGNQEPFCEFENDLQDLESSNTESTLLFKECESEDQTSLNK